VTPLHSAGTLVMPEEPGFDQAFERDQSKAQDFQIASVQTHLTRVDNPALQHTLDVFDDACAPSLELLRSVMARALVEAREPHEMYVAANIPTVVTRLREVLLPWGNAVLWLDGRCEYLTGFISDAAVPRPFVFANTWTQQWDEPAVEDELSGQDDAVRAVEALACELGLPVKDVLKAAGIKKSSFYSWKQPDAPRPRVASQGQLWALAQAVEDLAECTGGNVRQWLLARDERRKTLIHGEFDRLVAEATSEQSMPRTRSEPPWAATFGVGAEHETPTDAAARFDRRLPPFTKATAAQVPKSPDRPGE
jgi:hypothetical protein